MSRAARPGQEPLLTGVAIHWREGGDLAALLAAWPRDPRFELLVVDNGAGEGLPERPGPARILSPGRNLGFAGAANTGLAAARGPILLLLNADARPEPGALERLLQGFAAHPDAAGLAPRLLDEGGGPQHRWQLRPLPSPGTLLAQALFLDPRRGPAAEPPPGAPVEQPAAAALALRRGALEAVGGLDEGFFPAWFEDVDLARRLRAAGLTLRYWPAATFRHRLGSSLPRLGYGAFLWIYYRNLHRYLAKHHGGAWVAALALLLPAGALARLALLPLRRPRRAGSRGEAARGLLAVATGALTGWRRPRSAARLTEARGP